MLKSMTGFGTGTVSGGQITTTVSVKAVNGRYLDVRVHGFELHPNTEMDVRNAVKKSLLRGTLHVKLDIVNGGPDSQKPLFNRPRFEALEAILLTIQKEYGRHLDPGAIITSNDLFTYGEGEEVSSQNVLEAVDKACQEVDRMRTREGELIQTDLEARINTIAAARESLEPLVQKTMAKLRERYRARVLELVDDVALGEARLEQEVVHLAERSDVSEEILRLGSHLDQFRSLLTSAEPVGRRLNFLLQEIGREINTIGSKSGSEKIIPLIIEMKDEVEKLKEQVQNVL